MPDKHLSSQFDHELNTVSSRLMEMGGLVESQIQQAVYALSLFVEEVADQVIKTESQVNSMEIEIDRELSTIIARRQPTAKDLRLLMAISKATANLERAGDEANKIARMVKSLINNGGFRSLPSSELRLTTEMASSLLRKALDAFARLDTSTALAILKEDDLIDKEFDGFVPEPFATPEEVVELKIDENNERMDIIGQNGNEGLHYENEENTSSEQDDEKKN